ncbi:MAG: DNA/pantothenate metabolism flavoprotein domain protein [Herbinix sp.]|jgi:phosphopantothenate-cysteine ligase|nr:DNA/pantothenate metabolism flavoprotein domain protein [Herbinix sp.]
MKVLITAGGTTEPIDSVRSITNTSTGKLGSLIAEAFSSSNEITKIYYVCGKNSIVPQSDKTEVVFIDTVASLEVAVKNIFEIDSIDMIIHSMAVSDYRVKAVTSGAMLSKTLNTKLEMLREDQQLIREEFTVSLFQDSDSILNSDGKIRSNINNLILCMEQTPKVISSFQKIAPQAMLVGFKLLDHVGVDELIDTAFHVLQDNSCSFVLANDLRDITKEQHIGYLIHKNKEYSKWTTKEEIAQAIVKATLKERGEGV